MLEVSSGDISSLSLGGTSQNQNYIEELKIINNTVENLEICKNYYADVYVNVIGCFQNYLRSAPDVLIQKMQDHLRLNLYSYVDLKNEPNARKILQTFDRFFFAFGRFPAINEMTIVPTAMCLVLFNRATSSCLLNCIKDLNRVIQED